MTTRDKKSNPQQQPLTLSQAKKRNFPQEDVMVNEMHTVAEDGSVWRFDGKLWQPVTDPVLYNIATTITCLFSTMDGVMGRLNCAREEIEKLAQMQQRFNDWMTAVESSRLDKYRYSELQAKAIFNNASITNNHIS